VQPSSLIFLAIVAIWVAYLIQHWVRRREHLATARSVDKFSEAMRVLERRNPLSTTAPVAGAAALRAGTGTGTGSQSRPDLVRRRATVSSPLRARGGDGPLPPAHPVPLLELVPHRTAAQVAMRRVRGIFFLAALVAVPATLVLSIAHILKWLSVGIALGGLLAAFVWLRVSAVREHQARAAHRAERRRLERARARVAATARPRRDATPASGGAQQDPHTEDAAPGSWKPVPVPPPTYTLKEPAYRSEPGTHSDRPVPVEVEDDDILAVPVASSQRVVGS
jgi:type II secretory pathway pseudopilin PulG